MAAALAACHRTAQAPSVAPLGALAPVSANVPLIPAPPVADLPAAPPAPIAQPVSQESAYAFADRAAALANVFGDAPPDYTYDFGGGVRPEVWRTSDNYQCVLEQIPGGYQYYYYEPGSDQPFYVQGPDYGYGFSDGALVAVYDAAGQELSPYAVGQRAAWAGRYLEHGRALYRASLNAAREGVAQASWAAQQGAVAAQRRAWAQEQQSNGAWQAYHAQYGPQEAAHWAGEQVQRLVWAARVDQQMHDPGRASRDWARAQADARLYRQPPPQSYGGPAQGYGAPAPASGATAPTPYYGPPPNAPGQQGVPARRGRLPGVYANAPQVSSHAPRSGPTSGPSNHNGAPRRPQQQPVVEARQWRQAHLMTPPPAGWRAQQQAPQGPAQQRLAAEAAAQRRAQLAAEQLQARQQAAALAQQRAAQREAALLAEQRAQQQSLAAEAAARRQAQVAFQQRLEAARAAARQRAAIVRTPQTTTGQPLR